MKLSQLRTAYRLYNEYVIEMDYRHNFSHEFDERHFRLQFIENPSEFADMYIKDLHTMKEEDIGNGFFEEEHELDFINDIALWTKIKSLTEGN